MIVKKFTPDKASVISIITVDKAAFEKFLQKNESKYGFIPFSDDDFLVNCKFTADNNLTEHEKIVIHKCLDQKASEFGYILA